MGLGQRQHEFGPDKSRWVNLGVGLVSLLIALGLGLLTLYIIYEQIRTNTLDRIENDALPVFVMALIVLAVSAAVLWNAWQGWRVRAELYAQGFAYANGGDPVLVRWDEIDQFWMEVTRHYTNGIYTRTTHRYTVHTRTNHKVTLTDSLAEVEKLGTAIEQASAEALWPAYVRALNAGQRLQFGPLALDKTGLYTGQKALTWAEVKSVRLQNGELSVQKHNGGWFNWTSARVPQIPNFLLFYSLLGHLTHLEN